MRVSSVLLSALVAFGAVAVAPLAAVSAASQSPAQTKIDTLKSLIESQAGVNPPAQCVMVQASANSAPNAMAPPKAPNAPPPPPPPSADDICHACQGLLKVGAVRTDNAKGCGHLTGSVKTACEKEVQPYFAECANKAMIDAFDQSKGAMSAEEACSRMTNGFPGDKALPGWKSANAQPFCAHPPKPQSNPTCDLCNVYAAAPATQRAAECAKAAGTDTRLKALCTDFATKLTKLEPGCSFKTVKLAQCPGRVICSRETAVSQCPSDPLFTA